MNLRIALTIALLASLFSTQSIFAQADQAVRGAAGALQDKVAENQEPLTAGPKDPEEVKAPGKIDENASREFKETKSGLKYRILRNTEGKKPTASDKVEVHYKGWLNNKKIFDSSYRRGQSISFGLNQVIKGWTEGMQLVGEGGMIELDIPHELGYGERGTPGGPIPPKAQLHFIVELISVK